MNVESNPTTPPPITMTSSRQRNMSLYLIIVCEQKYLYCLRVAEQRGTRLKLQYCVACEKTETEIRINLLMSGGGFYF
jgi:hypothetical protein